MKKYGIMAAVFAAGMVLIGIGGGIAFAEYSSFTYGGRKMLGSSQMITKRIEEKRTEGVPFRIVRYREIDIVEEESLPADQLVFEFEYNPDYVNLKVDKYIEETEYEETEYTEESAAEDIEEGEDPANTGESLHTESEQGADTIEMFQIWEDRINETELMWNGKDEVLQALKKRKIYEYDTEYVKKITVYMSPKAKEEMNESWR